MADESATGGVSVSHVTAASVQETYAGYPTWEGVMPWPPLPLLFSVGSTTLENFVVVADAWMQKLTRYLPPDAQVLDVGCGCGRLARFLATHGHVRRYVGFDVVRESIAWCNRFIVPYTGARFEFLHFDIYSAEYNARGAIRAQDFHFPCADGSTHLVLASSLFTHVLEPDSLHYLAEVRRILAPGGVALVTIHSSEATAEQPYLGSEIRIDIHPPYWRDMLHRTGLGVRDQLDDFCGQSLYVLEARR